jgi:hypothetical protein
MRLGRGRLHELGFCLACERLALIQVSEIGIRLARQKGGAAEIAQKSRLACVASNAGARRFL